MFKLYNIDSNFPPRVNQLFIFGKGWAKKCAFLNPSRSIHTQSTLCQPLQKMSNGSLLESVLHNQEKILTEHAEVDVR